MQANILARREFGGRCSAGLVRDDAQMDLTGMGVRELLSLESQMLSELRRRDLVRTNNKPLGDIAERVVLEARGGVLEPNSTKSHDVTDVEGRRIQVKAMGARAAGRAAKFSAFRSFGFDTVIFLVFDPVTFDIGEAWEAPAEAIERGTRFVTHVAGRQPTLSQVRAVGTDVTAEMAGAWSRVDSIR